MALDFTVKDIIHQVIAKFVPNHLPNAVKPYHLKCVFQPEPDARGIEDTDGLIAGAPDGKTGLPLQLRAESRCSLERSSVAA